MTYNLYAVVSSLAVSFAHLLICSLKRVYSGVYSCPFLSAVFIYDTRHMMSQITLTKKNLKNTGLNPGQMVHTVPSESGSDGTHGTGLVGFFRGL